MNIAVLGTGTVGRTIAGKLSELGHVVVVGTRDPQATVARTESDAMGNPPYSAWQAENPAVRLAPFAEAAAFGELVVLATSGSGVARRPHPGGCARTWRARCCSTSPIRWTAPRDSRRPCS